MSLKDAAVYLGVEKNTLRKWVQRRLIPYYRYPLVTSRPRFKKKDLDDFMEARRVAPRAAWPARRMDGFHAHYIASSPMRGGR